MVARAAGGRLARPLVLLPRPKTPVTSYPIMGVRDRDAIRAQVPAHRQGTKGVGSGAGDDPLMQLLKVRELMTSQDNLDIKFAMKGAEIRRIADGRPPEPVTPTLNQFIGSQTDSTWREVLRDPTAALMMRTLRRRVAQLDDPQAAIVPSTYAYSVLNNWPERTAPGPKVNRETLTQPRNPMAWRAELSAASSEECRKEAAKRHPPKQVEGTSFWCPRWGAVCSDVGLDTNFQYTRKHNLRGGGWPNPQGGGPPPLEKIGIARSS